MKSSEAPRSVSRRTALAGLGAGGLGLALAATTHHAAAQEATPEMTTHPLVGSWLLGTGPTDFGVVHWDADGSMTYNGFIAPSATDSTAIHTNPPFMGVWEPDGERGFHITFMAMTLDATGAVTGTITVDGYPVANEDGQSFWDDGTRAVVTLRDATGAVSQEIAGVPPVAGVRMRPGKPGYDEVLAMLATLPAATPTS